MPEPWRSHVDASPALIDDLETRIAQIAKEPRRSRSDHRYIPILMSAPGVRADHLFHGRVRARRYHRFASLVELTGYTCLCRRVKQSGQPDGHLT